MKKSRVVAGLIFNLLIVAAAVVGVLNGIFGFLGAQKFNDPMAALYDFNAVCGAFVGLIGLLAVIADFAYLGGKKPTKFLTVMKLMAFTTAWVTMIVNLAVVAPNQADGFNKVYDYQFALYFVILLPVLSLVSFIVENKARLRLRAAFLGMLPPIIYWGTEIALVNTKIITDNLGGNILALQENYWVNVAWWVGIVLVSYLVALLLILVHNNGRKEEVEAKEPVKEAAPEAEEKPADNAAEKPEEKADNKAAEPANPTAKAKPGEVVVEEVKDDNAAKAKDNKTAAPAPARAPAPVYVPKKTYQIIKTEDEKWAVVANGKVAIREFESRSEALAFTKGLIESHGGVAKVHFVRGKIL
ncbi:MAG: hypothetical protein J6O18_10795 [Bacilli bacterium]|nr:hypothetical protein [Bacilli bacterium]